MVDHLSAPCTTPAPFTRAPHAPLPLHSPERTPFLFFLPGAALRAAQSNQFPALAGSRTDTDCRRPAARLNYSQPCRLAHRSGFSPVGRPIKLISQPCRIAHRSGFSPAARPIKFSGTMHGNYSESGARPRIPNKCPASRGLPRRFRTRFLFRWNQNGILEASTETPTEK